MKRWEQIKVPSKRWKHIETVRSYMPIFEEKTKTPPSVLQCRLYAEEITIEKPKNKLDKTSIKFYSTMILIWVMFLIASWMQHIFIFILCESVSVAVVCLIIRSRIKKNSLTSHIPQDH